MTPVYRTFDGKRALEAGPMSLAEFRVALGITSKQAATTMDSLIRTGVAERTSRPGFARYVYRLVP